MGQSQVNLKIITGVRSERRRIWGNLRKFKNNYRNKIKEKNDMGQSQAEQKSWERELRQSNSWGKGEAIVVKT